MSISINNGANKAVPIAAAVGGLGGAAYSGIKYTIAKSTADINVDEFVKEAVGKALKDMNLADKFDSTQIRAAKETAASVIRKDTIELIDKAKTTIKNMKWSAPLAIVIGAGGAALIALITKNNQKMFDNFKQDLDNKVANK